MITVVRRVLCLGWALSLTLVWVDLYITVRYKEPPVSLADLESKLDELTELCEALLSKQSQLQADNVRLSQERSVLLERNVAVKGKVEAMILRLKSLEQD
jgi:cell division protein ZapB